MVTVEEALLHELLTENKTQKEELLTTLGTLKQLVEIIAPMMEGKSLMGAASQIPKMIKSIQGQMDAMPELFPYFQGLFQKYGLIEVTLELPAAQEQKLLPAAEEQKALPSAEVASEPETATNQSE